ncbi:hypothetical protein JFQ93_004007 [Aeromonas sobria]|nr:hypothetical protein [Aeromonas sobria]
MGNVNFLELNPLYDSGLTEVFPTYLERMLQQCNLLNSVEDESRVGGSALSLLANALWLTGGINSNVQAFTRSVQLASEAMEVSIRNETQATISVSHTKSRKPVILNPVATPMDFIKIKYTDALGAYEDNAIYINIHLGGSNKNFQIGFVIKDSGGGINVSKLLGVDENGGTSQLVLSMNTANAQNMSLRMAKVYASDQSIPNMFILMSSSTDGQHAKMNIAII